MVQSLDVISVNLWQILISLANLLILFLIIKKFLFKPVKNILSKREGEIAEQYAAADVANSNAQAAKREWEAKLETADLEADRILGDASDNAKYRSEKIVREAEARAEGILRKAQTEAELEYKKAAGKIKDEIVGVSGAIAEKILEREINEKDHHNLIDSFIEGIGDDNARDQ